MTRLRTLSLVAATATLLAGIPSAAVAATATAVTNPCAATAAPRSLATLRARGDCEISRRLTTLSADATKIGSVQTSLDATLAGIATHFPRDQNAGTIKSKVDGDLHNVVSLLNTDQAGLTSLKGKIDTQDTTLAQLAPDVRSIVTAYRVYVLVDPIVHLTIASDREVVLVDLLTDVEQVETQRINSLPPTTLGLAAAKSALTDLGAKLTDAANHHPGGIAAAVAALQPSGYPGNVGTLTANASLVAAVRDDLTSARADVQKIRTALR